MKCFIHDSVDAVGICRSCFKAICRECVEHTKPALVCSDVCLNEINEQTALMEKSKSLFRIRGNTNPQSYPSPNIAYYLSGALFAGLGLFEKSLLLILMGVGFILIGLISAYRIKKYYQNL